MFVADSKVCRRPMPEIQNTIAMRLRRAYLTLHRAAQAQFAPLGMTVDQYVVLAVLADEDGITQSAIADRMASDANTITAMLRLLEQRDLIERRPSETDRRARQVLLTSAGKKMYEQLVQISAKLHNDINQTLAADEREQLFSMLDRLAQVGQRDPDG